MPFPIRQPAVAGTFYPADPKALRDQIASCLKPTSTKITAKGIVVPHAGYIYSGSVAGQVYSQINIPDRLIILSPNHTGLGVPFSINNRGAWRLPMGNAQIDEKLADRLMKECPLLEVDTEAQMHEHSLEVQIPFLQFLKKDFRFVPITLGHLSLKQCEELGEALAQVIVQEKEPILIIASSDMNHYENQTITLEKDQWAIDKILTQDPKGLFDTVHSKKISMCGIIPTTVMLATCNKLKAKRTLLVDHKTSGDVSGDFEKVVGYAGLIIE